MEKNTRYLKQAIVVRKDLSMPTGKIAAMAAHAAMTFLCKRLGFPYTGPGVCLAQGFITPDEHQWLTELDPGLEAIGQLSFAKIVLAADSLEHLEKVSQAATDAGLTVHRVTDSGYSHNPAGTVAAIAIGPHWPEQLAPVTGSLKIYR